MAKNNSVMYANRFTYWAHLFGAVILGMVALFLALSLFSHSPHDASWAFYSNQGAHVGNWCGPLGAQVAAVCIFLFGAASLWLVVMLISVAYALGKWGCWYQEWDRLSGYIVLLFVTSALLYASGFDLLRSPYPGGACGELVYTQLVRWCGVSGSIIFLVTLIILSFFVVTRLTLAQLAAGAQRLWQSPRMRSWRKNGAHALHAMGRAMCMPCMYAYNTIRSLTYAWFPHESADARYEVESKGILEFEHAGMHDVPCSPAAQVQPLECVVPAEDKECGQHENSESVIYTLPGLESFFSKIQERDDEAAVRSGKDKARLLEEKLARFGVEGHVVSIKRGPVVTMFEYKPDIDAKLSKIVNLADDLALALQALSIRIIAPIPGTAVVGFEVAYGQRTSVPLAACMHEPCFAQSSAALPLLLGQDTVGKSVVVDLTRMPHLLVAGATGAGKSVLLNSMLMSMLCKCSPEELKLILIDPKRLEFVAYADIGHLLFPIVTDAKTAVRVLGYAVQEMDTRYARMAAVNARTLVEYNERVEKKDALPRLVVVIDELADLMMTAGKLCEEHLARLTHMARAAGIHVIVATQRPSVDVITGVIKANFPSRIALRVPSKIDSRTILDCTGAESLLGQGDMLMLDAHDTMLKRVHGAYVSEKEIIHVTDAIRAQSRAHYQELPSALSDESALDEEDGALYEEAVAYVRQLDEVSISLLQRKFRIGYNRAARFIERLEAHGLIMPSEGGKARKVLK